MSRDWYRGHPLDPRNEDFEKDERTDASAREPIDYRIRAAVAYCRQAP
jgi:hypothetical protein